MKRSRRRRRTQRRTDAHNDTQMRTTIYDDRERPEDELQPPTDNPLASGGTEASLRSPSVDDVFAVRHDLTRFVPLELADMILENAMYWPKVSASRTEPRVVTAGYDNVNNPAVYYVVTPPIPYVQDGHIEVRKVRFSLESHDQGWGGNLSDRGTYVASWTWFEAAIIRDDDPSIGEFLLGLDTMQVTQQKELPKVLSAEVGTAPDGSTRWPIQHNIHVSSVFKRHEVTWTDEDSFGEVTEADAAKHGSGTGRGFVSTLSEGDRVAVVVRARFPGWANHVSSVSVDVFYSV